MSCALHELQEVLHTATLPANDSLKNVARHWLAGASPENVHHQYQAHVFVQGIKAKEAKQ